MKRTFGTKDSVMDLFPYMVNFLGMKEGTIIWIYGLTSNLN